MGLPQATTLNVAGPEQRAVQGMQKVMQADAPV